jgi:hypothetical protein
VRIAVWHNLPSGGGKRALVDQVAALQARGHHIESWCPPSADQDFLPLGQLIPEHVVPVPPVSAGSAPLSGSFGSISRPMWKPWTSTVETARRR